MGVYIGKEKVAPIRHTKINNPTIPWPKNADIGKTLVVKENLGYDLEESSGGGVTIVELSGDLIQGIFGTASEMIDIIVSSQPDDTGTGIDLYEPLYRRLVITEDISNDDLNAIKSVCTNIYSGKMVLIKTNNMGIYTPTHCAFDDNEGYYSVSSYVYMVYPSGDYLYNIRVNITHIISQSILNNGEDVYCDISVECVGVTENVQPEPISNED